MPKRNAGWRDDATRICASWIASSRFNELLRETAADCLARAAEEGCSSPELLNRALSVFLANQLPMVLSARLDTLRDDEPILEDCDPDGFVPPFAAAGLLSCDWQQVGQHWADTICPVLPDGEVSA